MKRVDGRTPDKMRKVTVKMGYLKFALGSCMIEFGDTRVVCSASVEEKVAPFLKGQNKGWVTGEYGMIPASCTERISREASKGKLGGRTHEIQRLLGRSFRSVVDLKKLGERTIWLDADVIQGDGGTRTASITGCFLALHQAVSKLMKQGLILENPISDYVAAVSVGIVNGTPCLDLCYLEDSKAEVDMNFVMTSSEKIIEVQGTAEGKPFGKAELDKLYALGKKGIHELVTIQKKYAPLS